MAAPTATGAPDAVVATPSVRVDEGQLRKNMRVLVYGYAAVAGPPSARPRLTDGLHRLPLPRFNRRSAMTALAGAAAGILGLKGWAGFAFYPVVWFTLAALFLLKTGWRPTAYFKSPYTVLTEGMLGGLQVRCDSEHKTDGLQGDLT